MKGLNHWTRLKVTHAHLGTRKVLSEVQDRFKQADSMHATPAGPDEPRPSVDELQSLIELLPVGCWSMNNCEGVLTVNLHTHKLHSAPCQFIRSFEGKDVEEVKEAYLKWRDEQEAISNYKLF